MGEGGVRGIAGAGCNSNTNDPLATKEQSSKGDVDALLSILLVEPYGVFAASMN